MTFDDLVDEAASDSKASTVEAAAAAEAEAMKVAAEVAAREEELRREALRAAMEEKKRAEERARAERERAPTMVWGAFMAIGTLPAAKKLIVALEVLSAHAQTCADRNPEGGANVVASNCAS
jgi:hypothetical protein